LKRPERRYRARPGPRVDPSDAAAVENIDPPEVSERVPEKAKPGTVIPRCR
jgi:hypothetical protein